ncbi:MAG: ribonuclease HII [bacterium]
MLQFERQFWEQGCVRLAGVDEAGRGPLAGPVVAAAVVFDRAYLEAEQYGVLLGIDDSKVLTEAQRGHFHELLTQCESVSCGIGSADVAEIDRLNILRATHLAMGRALSALSLSPDFALVDGLPVKGLPCPSLSIVDGDARCLSIAAASIVAKVTRDRMMRDLDGHYPVYGFAQHKGYGTKAHLEALLKYGPSPVHRRSFRPVTEAIRLRLSGEARTEMIDKASELP